MRIAEKAKIALANGFAEIAKQFQVPGEFSDEVIDQANGAVGAKDRTGSPLWRAGRQDATQIPLVTLDPASSTDLDQAFALERDGEHIVLQYALADVAAFAGDDSLVEQEAWRRGVTIYSLAKKIPLYPTVISQNAASLLPDGPRQAVLVVVAMDPAGRLTLRSVDRVICRSRAKLSYDAVQIDRIPNLAEFANRMWTNETERGAIRVEFPQQEVVSDPSSPGGVRLDLRARLPSELVNATLSLAVNMAIGSLFKQSQVGLFRVMEDPAPNAVARLRLAAHALGIEWPSNLSLRDLQRRMDANNITHQRFLLEARRAGGRASYAVYDENKLPWHSAVAAIYSHATAPMRRLADRYVLELALLLSHGKPIPSELTDRLGRLPATMERCEGRAANVDRSVIDLLEAVSLQHRVGEVLLAEVVDAEAGVVQTTDSAIRSRATRLKNAANGDWVHVRIESADPATRRVVLAAVDTAGA
ncbi:MAG: RNB domain-containing ribonuclease [Pirellula sp.]